MRKLSTRLATGLLTLSFIGSAVAVQASPGTHVAGTHAKHKKAKHDAAVQSGQTGTGTSTGGKGAAGGKGGH
jgi:hypothetical protein